MSEASALSPFEELIQSKLFTFRVGKDEGMKEFTVHSKAVAATSPYFYATVNNGMKESQEGTGEVSDVEPEDFARFIEYAYRHDYTVPSWVQEEKHGEDGSASPPPPPVENHWSGKDEPEPEVPAAVESAFGAPFGAPFGTSGHQGAFLNSQNQTFFGSSPTTKKKKSKKPAQSDFDERNYLPSIQPKTIMLTAFEPQYNTTSDQDFTPVFLAHARLYTFACTHFVDPLKCLTLHKLHRTLLGFRLYERRVHDVVELARYAYQQNADRKEDGTIDELRKLVVDYTVREVLTFGKHPDFVALLSEGGELVEDFLGVLYKEKLS